MTHRQTAERLDQLAAAHAVARTAFYVSRADDNDGREADALDAAERVLLDSTDWPATDCNDTATMIAATIRNGALASRRYATWRDTDPDQAA